MEIRDNPPKHGTKNDMLQWLAMNKANVNKWGNANNINTIFIQTQHTSVIRI